MTLAHANQRNVAPRRRRKFEAHAETLEGRTLLSAGQLDSTFSGDGYALIAPTGGSKNRFASARAVEVLPSGRILVGGYDDGNFALYGLDSNGSLDASFGSAGRAVGTAPGSTLGMATQADGRIVLAGFVANQPRKGVADRDIRLLRYHPNGTLDLSFSGDGIVTTAISTVASTAPGANKADYAQAVAVQPLDQKILVGGSIYDGPDYSDSVLVRYNTDGSLDTTFGQGGIRVTPIGVDEDSIQDLAVLPDGRILAAGFTRDASGQLSAFVARYNTNGSFDPSFGPGGSGVAVTTIGTTAHTKAHALSVLPDGRILVTGYHGNSSAALDVMLARYTPNGLPDTSFGGGSGFIVFDGGGSERANDMAVLPDGRIVVVGQTTLPNSATFIDPFVARFQADGTPDPGFGAGGIVVRPFSTAADYFESVALQTDGRVVAVGLDRVEAARSVTEYMLVARFQGDPAPLLAAAAAPSSVQQSLTAARARPVLGQALAYWRARGADTTRLGHVDLVIADLGGNRLGEASGSTVTLDDNAAGWGWKVGRGLKSPGRVDLLSALKHEVGHLLGHDHAEGGVMAETLAPVVRRLPVDRAMNATFPGTDALLLTRTLKAFRGLGRRNRAAARG